MNHSQQENLKIIGNMAKIKHKIIVISGKGGVGKTSVSVNLAKKLSSKNFKVGILDADVHGPNVAKMLGIEDARMNQSESGLDPIAVSSTLSAVSLAVMGFQPDQPFIWRGPMKANVIRQLLEDANWGELDFLIVDLPPGTGDEALSICQLIPDITGAVIVTTPQDVAILDSQKSIRFIQQLNIRILGLVENMSGFVCPECKSTIPIFKQGGGKKAADEFEIPFLSEVPFDLQAMLNADAGNTIQINAPLFDQAFDTISAKVIESIKNNL